MTPTLQLASDLIARRSVTPDDDGCQQLMMERLGAAGFNNEPLRFGDVDNFWSRRGTEKPVFCFAGHTDVVPTGQETKWEHAPFEPLIKDGMLYGRGAADMKGSLACMIIAVERFVAKHPNHKGSIAFLITSPTRLVDDGSPTRHISIFSLRASSVSTTFTVPLCAGPSSSLVIKNGRRGSLGAVLKVKGIQGHVAYPHLAKNPIHVAAPALAELAAEKWDNGNDFFPATSFQISNINGGTGATNVIPGELEVVFNFRFSTELTADILKERTEAILDKHGLDYEIQWNLSGQPFLTAAGALVEASVDAIRAITGRETELSTAGGTSDGRFIAPTGAQVLELGPCNDTIHKVDECIKAEDLNVLTDIYERLLENLLA